MLKIGDFSKLSMISIRMLRYFDEKNLLRPSKVDWENNYRYYEESQLVDACNIKYLQAMGFSTKEIKKIIKEDDPKLLGAFLENQKISVLEEYNKALGQIKLLEISLSKIKGEDNFMSYSIIEKTFPSMKVISLRRVIDKYEDEGILWGELGQYMEENKVILANPCYSRAIFHDEEFRDNNVDVELQLAVIGDYQDSKNILVKMTDAIEIASATFKGSYEQIDLVNQSIAKYMAKNNYSFNGPMFNIYHVSPATDPNPENWVTESCYPIKK